MEKNFINTEEKRIEFLKKQYNELYNKINNILKEINEKEKEISKLNNNIVNIKTEQYEASELEKKLKIFHLHFCHNCNNKIIENNETLICVCGLKYCGDCWDDANDEYFRWWDDGTPRNKNGCL